MQKPVIVILSSLLFIGFSSFNLLQTATLTVEVLGLRNNDGQLMISLNQGEKGFPEEDYYKQFYFKEYTSPGYTIVIENVPYGNYAVSLLHDENEDGEMEKNFLGIPKEGFAFSRDYNVVMRAPKYEEANFDINEKEVLIEVNMQY